MLVCVTILSEVMGHIVPLAKSLQERGGDLVKAVEAVKFVKSVVGDCRDDWDSVYSKATELADQLQTELVKPRVIGRQRNRANVSSSSVSEHYRLNLFLPLVDSVMSQMTDRFGPATAMATRLGVLIPKYCHRYKDQDMKDVHSHYKKLLDCTLVELNNERKVWLKCVSTLSESDKPDTATATLDWMKKNAPSLPLIERCITLFATIPVVTAENERSFSALKRLKTCMRSTMTQDRLNGLTMMHVHGNELLNSEDSWKNMIDRVLTAYTHGKRQLVLK